MNRRCFVWVCGWSALGAIRLRPATAVERGLDPRGTPERDKPGLYIWFDAEGWHLASYAKKKGHVFRGTIKVQGGKAEGHTGKKLEGDDYVRIDHARNLFTIKLSTGKRRDHICLLVSAGTKKLVFDLQEDGQEKPQRIYIGGAKRTPSESHFELSAQ